MVMKWCTKLAVALKRCPIDFQGHLSNFKVTRLTKSPILTQNGCFQTVTSVKIHWWLWNDAQSLKQHIRGVLLFFKVMKFQGHPGQRITDFDPNWAFPGSNFSCNFLTALKLCTKLEVAYKKCPFVFQGHLSNFKVKWEKIADFDLNWAYPDCNYYLKSPMDLKWCKKLGVV